MSAGDWVHLDVLEVLRETEMAFLLLLEGGEELWTPKSVIADGGAYAIGDERCTISVRDWWAAMKGLD